MSNFESFLLNILSSFYTNLNTNTTEPEFEVIPPETNSNGETNSTEETNVWTKYPLLSFLKDRLETAGFQLKRTNDTCLIKYKRNFDFNTFSDIETARYFRSFCFDPQSLVNTLSMNEKPTEENLLNALRNSYLSLAPPRAEDYDSFVKSLTDETKKNLVFEEFVDGVMINKFFHTRLNQWMITSRSIVGGQNNINNKDVSVEMMFEEASKNCNLTDDKLNKDYCYSFVLCHRDARVVKFYDTPMLYLVDTFDRTNQFKRLHNHVNDCNLQFPTVYTMTLNEMESKLQSGTLPYDFQGYVIRLDDRRTRFRNPEFEYARSMRLSESDPVMRFVHLRRNRQIGSTNNQPNTPKGWLNYFPEDDKFFERLRKMFQTLTQELHTYYIATNCYREGQGRISRDSVPQYLRNLMKLLHNNYLQSEDTSTGKKKPTTERTVIQFMNSEAPIFEISRALFKLEEFEKEKLLKLHTTPNMNNSNGRNQGNSNGRNQGNSNGRNQGNSNGRNQGNSNYKQSPRVGNNKINSKKRN